MASAEEKQKTKRLAIVIGNYEYESLNRLIHPEADAQTVNDKLDDLGFEVDFMLNRTRTEILKLLADRLSDWENEASEIVVYFSGYGDFIEEKIYITPVEVRESLPMPFIKQSLLDIDIIISILLECRNNDKVPIIIILDFCRFKLGPGSASTTHDQRDPLQSIKKANIAVLCSTATTEEDAGSFGFVYPYIISPYTEALLENMEEDDWSIDQLHNKAADQTKELRGKQVSWMHNSLYETYKFKQTQEPSE